MTRTSPFAPTWPQPLDPLHSVALSALVAAVPLFVVLILMGGLRKSGLVASVSGLLTAGALAVLVWHMPLTLALWSTTSGFVYAVWPVLWLVFAVCRHGQFRTTAPLDGTARLWRPMHPGNPGGVLLWSAS